MSLLLPSRKTIEPVLEAPVCKVRSLFPFDLMVGSTLPLPISKVVPLECIVPSVALDIDSPLPKVMSLPVTVKSPLKAVVVAVTAIVPFED